MHRVLWIVPVQCLGINKNGGRLFKWDTMLLEISNGLRHIPSKHIVVYTLIASWPQDVNGAGKAKRGEEGLSRLSGLFGLSGRDRETGGTCGNGEMREGLSGPSRLSGLSGC